MGQSSVGHYLVPMSIKTSRIIILYSLEFDSDVYIVCIEFSAERCSENVRRPFLTFDYY